MTQEALQELLGKKVPALKFEPLSADLTVIVPAGSLPEFLRYLKSDPQLQFENLMCLTAVDNLDSIDVVYHLNSYSQKHRLGVKARLPRENPKIPTVTGIWPGADWHEREAYDLYGVIFEGHPDLRRILLSDDWEGHPMRKDYKHWNLIPIPDDVTEVVKDYPHSAPPIR